MGLRSNPELGKKYYLCHSCKKGAMELHPGTSPKTYNCLACGAVVMVYPTKPTRPSHCANCGVDFDIITKTTGKDFESWECGNCDAMIVYNMTHRI